jgi:hypothetical protein
MTVFRPYTIEISFSGGIEANGSISALANIIEDVEGSFTETPTLILAVYSSQGNLYKVELSDTIINNEMTTKAITLPENTEGFFAKSIYD